MSEVVLWFGRDEDCLSDGKHQPVVLNARMKKFFSGGRCGIEQAEEFFFRFVRAAHPICPRFKLDVVGRCLDESHVR